LILRGKREHKSRKLCKTNEELIDSVLNDNSSDVEMENLQESISTNLNCIDQLQNEVKDEKKTSNEQDVFKISYSEVEPKSANETNSASLNSINQLKDIFKPSCRRSSYIQFFKSNLFVYGGKFEDDEDNETTFNDMYYLNVKKMEEWKILYEDKDIKLEQIKNAVLSSGIIFIKLNQDYF
jgi:hypothetical protein